MPPSKRILLRTALETETPPSILTPSQSIAQIVKSPGNNLYLVKASHHHHQQEEQKQQLTELLVELPPKFRNKIWLRRGGYVVIDTEEYSREKQPTIINDTNRDHYFEHEHNQQEEEKNKEATDGVRKGAGGQKKNNKIIPTMKRTSKINKRKETKVNGEIVNIVRSEKEWRKMPYWPTEFTQQPHHDSDDSDEEEQPPARRLSSGSSDENIVRT